MNQKVIITKEYLEGRFITKEYFIESTKNFVTNDYLDRKLENYPTKEYFEKTLDKKLDETVKKYSKITSKELKQHMTDLKTFFKEEDLGVVKDHVKTLEEDINMIDKRVEKVEDRLEMSFA